MSFAVAQLPSCYRYEVCLPNHLEASAYLFATSMSSIQGFHVTERKTVRDVLINAILRFASVNPLSLASSYAGYKWLSRRLMVYAPQQKGLLTYRG